MAELRPVLVVTRSIVDSMLSDALDGYPLEACGVLGGTVDDRGTATADACYPLVNLAASARIYEVDPRGLMRADRAAEAAGGQLIGVYHSHTHTEARPSPTDVAQAPDPDWHYVLVSLRDLHPSVRSWRIQGGKITEEAVVLPW